MVRVSAAILLIFTLLTGCGGQARRPAMIVGGALAIGGIAFTARATSRDCDPGAYDFECPTEVLAQSVIGVLIIAVGLGVFTGAALSGGDDSPPAPQATQPVSAPTSPSADAPPSDPSNPPSPMEAEPAQW